MRRPPLFACSCLSSTQTHTHTHAYTHTHTTRTHAALFKDFAGAGVVHMVGGAAGLVGAIVAGPRYERTLNHGFARSPVGCVVRDA